MPSASQRIPEKQQQLSTNKSFHSVLDMYQVQAEKCKQWEK